MRTLIFNNQIVDIDEKTAIGIDYQGYDVKNPGKRKVAVSNTFTIPSTAHNKKLIGFAGNPQSLSKASYDPIVVQYYNDNQLLIRKGRLRITEISDRISVFVFEKTDMWDQMADLMWPDFIEEFIIWMQEEKGLPSADNPFVGTFQAFIESYNNTTEGIILPFYASNLARHSINNTNYLEIISSTGTSILYLKYQDGTMSVPGLGGHFCCYLNTIFEFIEQKYNVDFSVLSEDYDYNIFQDEIASQMYIPLRNLSIDFTPEGFCFRYDNQGQFLPDKDVKDKEDKSLLDFTKAFFQHFNCLIDKVSTSNLSEKYIIRRFDNIIHAPIHDISGNMSGSYKFSPMIEGYSQQNYITFSKVYEGGSSLVNSKKITCKNKNIDPGGPGNVLFSIDAYIPGQFAIPGDVVPDMTTSDSFSSFVFFISQGQSMVDIFAMENGTEIWATAILNIARTYSLSDEYNTLSSMIEYPVLYEVKKWLTLNDIDKLSFFKRYWLRELNGYFFLNKISGFNPKKSTEPTTIELIKIPIQY